MNVPSLACEIMFPQAVDIGVGAVLVDVEVTETLSVALLATTAAEPCENNHVLTTKNDQAEKLRMANYFPRLTTTN